MRNVIFGVDPESIERLIRNIQKENPERLTLLVPFVDVLTKSPSNRGKYKGYHQIQIKALIPEDAILGEEAISDFGGFLIFDINSERVADKLKSDG